MPYLSLERCMELFRIEMKEKKTTGYVGDVL